MGVEKSHVGRHPQIPKTETSTLNPNLMGVGRLRTHIRAMPMSACSSRSTSAPASLSWGHFLTFLIALFRRHALRRQPLKQGAGSLQIRGRETFGEPIVNRCELCSRLVVATLAHPQTGNAEGDPQPPKYNPLPS